MAANFNDVLKILAVFILINIAISRITITRWNFGDSIDPENVSSLDTNSNTRHDSPPNFLGHDTDTVAAPNQELEERLNIKPIIAILAQEVSPSMKRALHYGSYIASSYVKFLEAAGARVVPALIDQPYEYYETMSKKVNGFFFPGGSVPVDSTSGFGRAGKMIMKIATESALPDRQLPVWGTCLGFELILYDLAQKDLRQSCQANNYPSKLKLNSEYASSKMFKNATKVLLYNMSHKNITSNFHHWCVTPKMFAEQSMNEHLNILTTSFDENGLEYVSTVEHKKLPIYATQWHPEKSQFEWPIKSGHTRIPHGIEAVELSQYLANFFVEQARRNKNRYPTAVEETKVNIHNYKEIYLSPLNLTNFQQCYFFP